jgi:ankyrin repeat protein
LPQEIVAYLLEKGAKADLKKMLSQNEELLHFCCLNQNVAALECLLQGRAKVNALDEHSATPLHHAAIGGDVKIIEILLKYKADIEANDQVPKP